MATKAEIKDRQIRKAIIAALKEVTRWKAYKGKLVRDDGLWVKENHDDRGNGPHLHIGSTHHRVPQLYIKLQPYPHYRDSENSLTRDELTDLWRSMRFDSEDNILPRPVIPMLGLSE